MKSNPINNTRIINMDTDTKFAAERNFYGVPPHSDTRILPTALNAPTRVRMRQAIEKAFSKKYPFSKH